ncbi:T-kininogen 2-like isoform X1 [Ambystoma mexicanum]|uniref:T-kininogen 2-like isoform X1 n=1 Tax=Ambystoma mexicanum TaxID=8296 RepID=UPI0037E7FD65
MKWFAVLFLCSQVLSSAGDLLPVQDASCNDPSVFEAVDLALRKYNTGRIEGNQFALNRITEAGTIAGNDSDEQYHVTYEIIESTCDAADGRIWQDCQFRPLGDAATGTCQAHVYIKKAENKSTIISQACNITTAEGPVLSTRYTCLGCPYPISSNSEDLRPIVRHAIKKFNDESNQANYFDVEQVTKATRQVVAGWNYNIEFTIKETDCAKNDFPSLHADCKLRDLSGICEAGAYVAINGSIAAIQQRCKVKVDEVVPPPIRRCSGCPAPMETKSKDLEEPLAHTLKKFNLESNHPYFYKVEHIEEATKQVVAGMKYVVTFRIKSTNCSKAANEELHDGCEFHARSVVKRCKAEIYVVPWLKKIEVLGVNCSLPVVSVARHAHISVRSPFRTVGVMKREAGHPADHGKGPGHKHGHKCKPPRGEKNKHGKKCRHSDHPESSEESLKIPTQTPALSPVPGTADPLKPTSEDILVKPTVWASAHHLGEAAAVGAVTAGGSVVPPMLPGILPILPGDELPDLPEPPAAMCPGHPWVPPPLSAPSPSPEPEEFNLEDFWLVVNEKPTQATEKKQVAVPSRSSEDFNDDDLLAALT